MIKRETPNTRLDLCSRMDLHICTYINACACACECMYMYLRHSTRFTFSKVSPPPNLQYKMTVELTFENFHVATNTSHVCIYGDPSVAALSAATFFGGNTPGGKSHSLSLFLSVFLSLSHTHTLSRSLSFFLSVSLPHSLRHTPRTCVSTAPLPLLRYQRPSLGGSAQMKNLTSQLYVIFYTSLSSALPFENFHLHRPLCCSATLRDLVGGQFK